MSLATRAVNRLRELYTQIWRRNKIANARACGYCSCMSARSACSISEQLEPRLMFSVSPVAADPLQDIAAEDIAPASGVLCEANLQTQASPTDIAAAADANTDGVVDLDDFIILKQNYKIDSAEWSQGNFNGDSVVDLDDFIILKQNYGKTTEPADTADTTAEQSPAPLTAIVDPSVLSYSVEDDGTITITDCPEDAEGELVIPDTIDGKVVTAIGDRAFYSCDGLTSVTIPDSVKVLGEQVFDSCSNLTSVVLPCDITVIPADLFFDCDALTSVTIPEGVTTIGEQAFAICSTLASITIPSSVKVIGDRAFWQCESLANFTIPNGVETLGEGALSSCGSLTSVTIPSSVSAISDYLFRHCDGLVSVNIPNSVTSIGKGAFRDCDALADVVIPNSVETLGEGLFAICNALTSVTVPASVTSIGADAFGECPALISIDVSAENQFYTSQDGVLFNKDMTELIQYPAAKPGEYTIPNSVITIVRNAFRESNALTSVTVGDNVATLGVYTFFSCEALTNVIISASVETIEADAFCYSDSLVHFEVSADNQFYTDLDGVLFNKDMTELIQYPSGRAGDYAIPEGVTIIAGVAFSGCAELGNLTVPASVTTIMPFVQCRGLTGIDVSAENDTYASQDGVLFSKDMSTLLLYPRRKAGNYTIAANVTAFHDMAFAYCRALENVTVLANVASLDDYLFAYCTELESVTVGASVTMVEYLVFTGCLSLQSITFEGDSPMFFGRMFRGCPYDLTIYFYEGANGFIPPRWAVYPCVMITAGDANADGVVNLDDFIILKQNYGIEDARWSQGDFSRDAVVDLDDFILLKQHYGMGA